ncbi:DUF397 domain-containing protein [Streptosporangium saharense]|uniref:DUF397 domain-containing protein n=1 Tax=Streptosporangium saharense TaxID=1706840 RepID=A0A7W7QG83_9ACTN|nr:DUF397 domain-containing protein [Streptosporangium saharense]MBB4912978.1 hypothetical protein [Streptosporangium saharense]
MSPDLTGTTFHKSSLSSAEGGNCVEVATNLPGLVAVRDNKNLSGPALTFSTSGWDTFVDSVELGTFDF